MISVFVTIPTRLSTEFTTGRPLIYAEPGLTVQEATELMIKNKIRKLPIVHGQRLVGIVTVTDLAVFLSPTKRPGLALSTLQAISRSRRMMRAL
jgi:predicted transcriptional regulator